MELEAEDILPLLFGLVLLIGLVYTVVEYIHRLVLELRCLSHPLRFSEAAFKTDIVVAIRGRVHISERCFERGMGEILFFNSIAYEGSRGNGRTSWFEEGRRTKMATFSVSQRNNHIHVGEKPTHCRTRSKVMKPKMSFFQRAGVQREKTIQNWIDADEEYVTLIGKLTVGENGFEIVCHKSYGLFISPKDPKRLIIDRFLSVLLLLSPVLIIGLLYAFLKYIR